MVLDRARVCVGGGIAIEAADMETRGDRSLNGAVFHGGIRLEGAGIGGFFAATDAGIHRPGAVALDLDSGSATARVGPPPPHFQTGSVRAS